MGNFIKIDRKILKWEWWSDINTCRLFLYMLIVAYWKSGNYKGKEIPRGSFPSSLSELSKETGLTENEVRTAIKHLKSTGEITSKSHSKFTVFTVKNYDLYQSDNKQNYNESTGEITSKSQSINEQITSKSQAVNELLTSTILKEDKNERIKEVKKENKKEDNTLPLSPSQEEEDTPKRKPKEKLPTVYYPNDELLDSAFKEFLVMRNKIKKPIATQQAMTRIMNKIDRLSGGDNDLAVKILNQSTDHCWQDVYELKEDGSWQNNNPTTRAFTDTRTEQFNSLMEQIRRDAEDDG